MIGNVTILRDQNNYGQRLQCYALQRHVKSVFGEEVVTLDLRDKGFSYDDGMFFHEFERDFLNIRSVVGVDSNPLADFKRVILGGDQVLNYGWNQCIRFITKWKYGKKNIFSYGAGIGPSHEIPSDIVSALESSVFGYGLREECKALCHAKTIDPVFLIPKDEWMGLASDKGHGFRGDVTYMVRRGMSDELSITGDGGEKEVLISKGYGKTSAPSPTDFLGLFRRAESITTNSFHGFAFGLIFGVKKINVINMSDHRIKNLINMLGVSFDKGYVINHEEISKAIDIWVFRADVFLESCLKNDPLKIAAYSKDRSIRDRSSSGGFCAELARYAERNSGVVYGGAFSKDFRKVVTTKVGTLEEYMSKLSQSKYSFCLLPKLSEVRDEVNSGRNVVFIGSPCQIFALRLFMKDIPENCILVDFRCRGYSNPKILSDFVDKAQKDGGEISSILFRHRHSVKNVWVNFSSGKALDYGSSMFSRHVHDVKNHIPGCGTCRFRHGLISCSDITVGDFWDNARNKLKLGREFTPERGCNIVCINTEKGRRMFDLVKHNLEFLDINDRKAETRQRKVVLKPSDVTRYVICQAIESRFDDI